MGDNFILDGRTIFNGNNPVTWTDLDCGVGQAVVFLKITHSPVGSHYLYFRMKDNTGSTSSGRAVEAGFVSAQNRAYMTVPADSGIIQWRGASQSRSTQIVLIGYFPGAKFLSSTLVSGGTSKNTWGELDIGVANALCFIKLETTEVASFQYYFRQKGESKESQVYDYGLSMVSCLDSVNTYAIMLSDADGKCEWKCQAAGKNISAKLVAYLNPGDITEASIGSYNLTTGGWHTIKTDLGQGILFQKSENTGSNDQAIGVRERGDTGLPNFEDGCSNFRAHGGGPYVDYSLIYLNDIGEYEALSRLGSVNIWSLTKLAWFSVGHWYMPIGLRGKEMPYEDKDKTKKLHIVLKNLSPTSKNSGVNGEVVIEVKYEPRA